MMKQFPLSLLSVVLLCASCLKLPPWLGGAERTVPPEELEAHRQPLIRRISALPDYVVHEESPAAFRKRLSKGSFRYVPSSGTSYLTVRGDGTFGKRVFIGGESGSLDVYITEDGKAELYHYNEIEKCLEQHKPVLMPFSYEGTDPAPTERVRRR